jgi:hypothetical protein
VPTFVAKGSSHNCGILALSLLLGCGGTLQRLPPVTVVSGVDLSRYSNRGFFFSTDPYTGPHETIGLVAVTSFAEIHQEKAPGTMVGKEWVVAPVPLQAVVDTVYARAAAMGADAFVKMEIHSVTGPATAGHPSIPGIEITGVAIKRRTS